ncbi:hypothetical protein D1155_07765 [Anaerotruncus sp. 80]|uniref:Phage XkdN-like protein n=1 Tax=Anaerotruncus colihominis TaxID=169435 RepID=A0A845QLC4_9FIRM|nr:MULTISPECIES: hypothetical protein [Anaerotruncus]NBH61543.1 hypothetical protein [Anaerotruncus colihominis]NCF02198.1 hypothetical protein [Anaerotruncus sp. 80]
MENNTQETMRSTYITPVTDPDIPAKVAEKIEKEDEYDLVSSLLAAAEYQQAPEMVKEVEIRRKGKLYFTVHVHPVSEEDISFARKKASKYYENPQGKKLPRVRGELDSNLFNSWIIYLATTEADREKIWGNAAMMKKLGHLKPVESINSLLIAGEKSQLIDLIFDISRMTDDEDEEEIGSENYAKN